VSSRTVELMQLYEVALFGISCLDCGSALFFFVILCWHRLTT
jgi:hypothetical protein